MGLRALIVDQDVEYRRALASALETLGYGCLAADHGWDALGILEYLDCDLIFIDLFNPRMEGIDAIMALRFRHPRARIVAVAGDWRTLRAEKLLGFARELGADAALLKPFDPTAMGAVVARLAVRIAEDVAHQTRTDAQERDVSQRVAIRARRNGPVGVLAQRPRLRATEQL